MLDARSDPQGAAVSAAARPGFRCAPASCIIDSGGAPARERGDARRADVRWLDPRCRPRSLRLRADERRLDAVGASVLAVARQAQVRCGCVPAGCLGADRKLRRGHAPVVWGCAARRWPAAAAAGRAAAEAGGGFVTGAARSYRVEDSAGSQHACGCATPAARHQQSVRRFPERRDARRIWSWRHAKAFAPSSISSATRPPAWRPTRARRPISMRWRSVSETLNVPVPSVGLTTFRQPYTPVTFGDAGRLRARRSVRSDPAHAHRWLGAEQRRGVRGCRNVEARLVLSACERGHACGCRARVPDGARGGGHVRRLDARQDRGRRAGRGGIPRSHVRQLRSRR